MSTATEMTVIIPVHNRAGIVGRTLQSVEAQSYRPLRVILVDNNSTDNTAEVLAKWKNDWEAPDFTIDILSETHPGATAARNKGLEATRSNYVMFFDSDDTMAPEHVARAMDAFSSSDRPDIVGWDIRIHALDGTAVVKPFYAVDTIWHSIMHGSMGTQRYAARTEVFRAVNGWNPDAMGWNDIEIAVRFLQKPLKIKKLAGITVDVYCGEESITGIDFSSTPWKWETALDFMEKSLPDRRRKRYVSLRRAILAGDYAREGAHTESTRLITTTLRSEPCPFYRMLYRAACHYVAHGHRGAARLLRPFF